MKVSPNWLFAWVILPVTSALAIPSASAEPTYGGKLGLAVSKWHLETELPVTTERKFRFGPYAGGFLQLRGWRFFGVQLEADFASRGTDTAMDGMVIESRKFYYFDVALLVRFELPLAIASPYVLGGGVGSYLARATLLGNDVTDQFQRYDRGVRFGGGISFGRSTRGTFFLEGRYDIGFRDIDKDSDDLSFRSRSITILAGYEFRRNRGKTERYPDEAKDSDQDGVVDKEDKCPMEKGVAPDGCPDRDDDKDGVLNTEDLCPKVKEEPGYDSTRDGCPDKDNDGVWDHKEHPGCIDKPEDKDKFEDDDGCPDPDNDGDGVLDDDDSCRNTPGTEQTNGCPDADGDGIPNKDDQCPKRPHWGSSMSEQGCPVVYTDEWPVEVNAKEIDLGNLVIEFEPGKYKMKDFEKGSPEILERIVEVLVDHPGIRQIVIEVHVGGKKAKDLSGLRAKAIRARMTYIAEGKDRYRQRLKNLGKDRKARTRLKRVKIVPKGLGKREGVPDDATHVEFRIQ